MHPAISLIDIYQRYISPYKGFRCAHRVFHGGCSCSQAVKQIIQSDGLLGGIHKIRERFRECQMAAAEIRHAMSEKSGTNGGTTSAEKRERSPSRDRTRGDILTSCNFLDCGASSLTIGFEGLSGCEIAGCLAF